MTHHGLARAGLTGHRGEAGLTARHRVVDDAEPPDPHLLQHVGRAVLTATALAAPSLHRQVELRDEPVGERGGVDAGEPHRGGMTGDLYPRPGRQLDEAPPVAPQHSPRLVREELEGDAGIAVELPPD